MMEKCLYLDRFAEMVNRPAHDPFWSHVENCSDCRALVVSHEAFLDAETPTEAIDLDDADRELAGRMDLALGKAEVTPAPRRSNPQFWYALAAVLVVGVGLVYWSPIGIQSDLPLPPPSAVVRGDNVQLEGYAAIHREDRLILRWPSNPQADTVVVIVWDEFLAQVDRLTTSSDSLLVNRPALVHRAAFAQVLFVAQGDTISRGPLFPIVLGSD
jgi:hypothetical protein